ncbi:transposase [Streptomyces gamaensis]|uniref:Transposase n=1 Tax=Streptomyces gamaensis TaxID=1763542 RepID=A0ABW0ZB29_9ACTN
MPHSGGTGRGGCGPDAAVTFKKTFGFHPLAAWHANTTECLAMLLRPGNADANTVADHIAVLTGALAQIPGSSAAKILVRADGVGATHALLEHLEALSLFSVAAPG